MAGCAPTSVQSYEACGPAQGLYAYPGPIGIPGLDPQYKLVAMRNKPAGSPADFAIVCEACLRARGLLYWKQNAGDCPAPAAIPGISSGQIVGLSGQAASGVLGGLGAAGVISGAATFGIGTAVTLAVSAIEGIFAHHAQAVANEQSTICSVAGYFNPLMKQIDNAVATGKISDQEGIAYVRQVAQQAITGLQGIYKVCNAACVYQGILKAHIDFVGFFYPLLSPIDQFTQNRPGQAPSTINAPGSVTDSLGTPPLRSVSDPTFAYKPSIVAAAPPLTPNKILPSGCTACPDYLNQGYNQQTGQSGQAADVPPTGTNWTTIGLIVAVLALIFVAVSG